MRLSFLFFIASLWPAATVADPQPLVGRVIDEAELDRALISKPSWLRGLHIVGQELGQAAPQVLTVLPEGWLSQKFCARITSINGSYAAVVEFDAPPTYDDPSTAEVEDDPSIEFDLRFDALSSALVETVTPENSGVALELGSCADTETTGQLPRQFIANYLNEASRPKLTEDGNIQVLLNMNIARADELIFEAWIDGDRKKPIDAPCRKLDIPEALAFNYRCILEIPPERLKTSANRSIAISYERLYRGRTSAPRAAEILIGADR